MRRILFADYETRSRLDIKTSTHSIYCAHPSTEILMVAVHEPLQRRVTRARLGPLRPGDLVVTWGAFDSAIYRALEVGREGVPLQGAFFDLQTVGLYLGLPRSLDGCAKALGLPVSKDARGTRLINFFCQPRRDGKFNHPKSHPEKWQAFRAYAEQDVVVLEHVYRKLAPWIPHWLREQYANHQLVERMNRRGVPLDLEAVARAAELVAAAQPALVKECEAICGLAPTQAGALANWLGVENVQKKNVEQWVLDPAFTPEQRRVMELRLKLNYPSIRKLPRMADLAGPDGRARDQFLNNGAHTGRLTSWGIQFHNMKAAKLDEDYFSALMTRPHTIADPIETTAKNVRGFIRAPAGRRLLVSDYSQIECRVLAWLAGEEKLLRAFRSGRDVYRMMAENLFGIPWQDIAKDSEERQRGKIVVLAAGYQLGPRGLIRNARSQWGLDFDKAMARRAIRAFRDTFTSIVDLWAQLDAAMRTLAAGPTRRVMKVRQMSLQWDEAGRFVVLRLPSGRAIRYLKPHLRVEKIEFDVEDENGEIVTQTRLVEQIRFWSRSGTQMARDWTYGGKLTENVTQAVAADLMLHGMRTAETVGFEPIMSVHDEVVVEIDEREASDETVEQLNQALCLLPKWAQGVPIAAEGWIDERYHK